MDTDLFRAANELAKGGLFRIHDGQGRRVECLSGCLWLTQHNDPHDTVLEAGEGFTIDRDGDTYLSALSDSRFVLLCDPGRGARSERAVEQTAQRY